MDAAAGPAKLAARQLRRDPFALVFGVLFVLLVVVAFLAPVWADIADTGGPTRTHLDDTIVRDGETVNVVSLDGVPIGPTWGKAYFLGADGEGRDIAVRLLYGARNSLIIGFGAAILTSLLAVIAGLIAGYFRGLIDGLISRSMDVLWAFPIVMLGSALGVVLVRDGIKLPPWNALGWDGGPALTIGEGSLLVPIFVIGLVWVVYLARPIRGQVLLLREREFVEAARAQGMGPWRIMFSELLPNLWSTVIVFFPLLFANAVLLESALSFLGAGVQSPKASWGTLMDDGLALLVTRPWMTIAPGLMLVICVLSINVFAESLRKALDPRGRLRLER